jgi:putative transposase
MARPLRIELPGGIYHVTARGDRREDIYLNDDDRLTWLEVFANVCARFNWRCHAYCLMSNHYHVVIETPEPNLAEGMRQLNGVYTQRFNRRHGRVGHVYQGRYKAILVEKDSYLLELSRYVVLNPVRAHMVKAVQDWSWSSYHATVGTHPRPSWLQIDWLLSQFASELTRAQLAYADFVRAGAGLPTIWEGLQGQIYLGGDAFIQRMKDSLTNNMALDEIPRAQHRQARSLAEHLHDLDTKDRNTVMALAYLEGGHAMKAIAKAFGVHYTTVSRAVSRYEDQNSAESS